MSTLSRSTLAAVALCAALGPLAAAADGGGRTLFIESAVESTDNLVTLPLHQGSSRGRKVWFVLLDASDGKDAARLRINQASKLANARGTAATQKVHAVAGGGVDGIDFPASVDFSPDHLIVPGPDSAPFPPLSFQPGSVGEDGYSPLIEFPDGRVLNAPHILVGELEQADLVGHRNVHDKVVSIDVAARTVTLRETDGFSGGKAVKYVSTDASVDLAAALEASTLAPNLAAAPQAGADGTDSSRASLALFVNGQRGADNPQRQGVTSALGDSTPQRELGPLNVLFWAPNQGRYSPLWDVHPAVWRADVVAAGQNLRQTDFGQVLNLGQKGIVTSVDGGKFRAFPDADGVVRGGVVVNCPIVSSD